MAGQISMNTLNLPKMKPRTYFKFEESCCLCGEPSLGGASVHRRTSMLVYCVRRHNITPIWPGSSAARPTRTFIQTSPWASATPAPPPPPTRPASRWCPGGPRWPRGTGGPSRWGVGGSGNPGIKILCSLPVGGGGRGGPQLGRDSPAAGCRSLRAGSLL